MTERITAETLLKSSKENLKQLQNEYATALTAMEILESITKIINKAGGGHNVSAVGNMKVADLALVLAHNNIHLVINYNPPKQESLQEAAQDSDDFSWLAFANNVPMTNPAKPPTKPLLHTNGYCDTCGDMYTKGWESSHPNCRRVP